MIRSKTKSPIKEQAAPKGAACKIFMEIPNDGGFIKEGDMVSGSHAAECRHAHVQRFFRFILGRSIVLVLEETGQQMEGPILELCCQPVVSLRVLPLEAHIHSHRLL